jgi:hypothetical protein
MMFFWGDISLPPTTGLVGAIATVASPINPTDNRRTKLFMTLSLWLTTLE